MFRKTALVLVVAGIATSCVSKKVFVDLEDKYNKLNEEKTELLAQNEDLLATKAKNTEALATLKSQQSETFAQKKALEIEKAALKKSYEDLKKTYDLLASKSSSALEKNAEENRELLAQLEDKETKLMQEGARLRTLETELSQRSKQIDDLEKVLADKDKAMQQLKNAVSNALKGFEGKGLTVVNKNGNVYVSMENKLLFNSGSWAVGRQGKEAVRKLSAVLAENPDINVLIEGHTDNDPYNGPVVKDNWDLSVKRATAIVRILQNSKVSASQITAAGRGEHVPVSSNETNLGKAKNRRIEIILSPNLDEVSKLLGDS